MSLTYAPSRVLGARFGKAAQSAPAWPIAPIPMPFAEEAALWRQERFPMRKARAASAASGRRRLEDCGSLSHTWPMPEKPRVQSASPFASHPPKKTETLRLAAFLPFQLSVLTNTISRRIAERYDAEFGLSIWQWRVMAVLGETPGLTASAVTERTAMDKVAVSRAVTGLRQRGLLERQAAAADARRQLLRLSEEGQSVYEQIVPLALSYERELEEAASPQDLLRLKRLLERFAAVVSPDRPLW